MPRADFVFAAVKNLYKAGLTGHTSLPSLSISQSSTSLSIYFLWNCAKKVFESTLYCLKFSMRLVVAQFFRLWPNPQHWRHVTWAFSSIISLPALFRPARFKPMNDNQNFEGLCGFGFNLPIELSFEWLLCMCILMSAGWWIVLSLSASDCEFSVLIIFASVLCIFVCNCADHVNF